MAVDLYCSRDGGPALDVVLREQEGVVRLEDVAHVMSRGAVRHAVSRGTWQMPHRGVYVAHNTELTPAQERWVCLRAAPRGSALAGLTAAELDGLRGFEIRDVQLVIPAHARPPQRPGLVVRSSTMLTTADVHPMRSPRRTRMPRSVIDGASWTPHEHHARAIVLAGVQQRLVRAEDLRDALGRRGQCRHRAVIVQSIDDAEGGIASVPEHDFQQICRIFGLPQPQRQAVFQRSDGRFYLDVYWHRYRISAEVHGIQHMEILNWDADLDRQATIVASGDRVLPFTSYAVRHHKMRVGALLTEALRNSGWRG
jgi:hypothetical protein